jgi:UPF0755 protein
VSRNMRGRGDLDDVDDLDVLDTYDWHEDPWDSSLGVSEVEQIRTQTRVAKWIGYGALLLVNVLIIGAGCYGWWYISQANAPGAVGAPIEFTIAEGETLGQVSERLEDEGFIRNAAFFRDYAGDHGGLDIVPGLYRIPTGDNVGNVLAVLRTPPNETFVNVTFPEGFTVRQMAARLAAELPNFSVDAFLAAANDPAVPSLFRPAGQNLLEGLLFPATYRVYNADSERQVVIRMVEQMERVGSQEEIEAGVSGVQPSYTPYQILIIASMIEREAKTEEDRPMIARVIYNRLAMAPPWRLNIDATVIYNVPPEQLEADGAITALRSVDTPWNTYTRDGLPQTPIANPGRASIEAALNPAPNPSPGGAECEGVPATQCRWLFYVIKDEQGNHAFSVTEEQFNADLAAAEAAGLL